MVDERHIRRHYPVGYSSPSPKRLTTHIHNGRDVQNMTSFPPYLPHNPEEYQVYGGRRLYTPNEQSYGQPNINPIGRRPPRQTVSDDDRHGYFRYRNGSSSPPRQDPGQRDSSPLKRIPQIREVHQHVKQPLVKTKDGKFLVKYLVKPSDDYQPKNRERAQVQPLQQEQKFHASPKRQVQQQKITKISLASQKPKQKGSKITEADLKRRMNKQNYGPGNSPERKRMVERRKGRKNRRGRSREIDAARRRHRSKGERDDEEDRSSENESLEPRERYRESPERRQISDSREAIYDEYIKSKDSSNIMLDPKKDKYNYPSEAKIPHRMKGTYSGQDDGYDSYARATRKRSYSHSRSHGPYSRGKPAYYPRRRRQSTPFECIEVGLDDKPWFEHVNDAFQESCPALYCESHDSDSDSEMYRKKRTGRRRYNEKSPIMRKSDCSEQVVIPPWLLCCGGLFIASFFI